MLVIYLYDKGLISKICTDFFNSEKKKWDLFNSGKKKIWATMKLVHKYS